MLFCGGRTNATKLLYEFKEGEYGKYADFCSLYPTIQYYKDYPIDHTEKIFNPKEFDEDWHGLIKCKILPPQGLYLAVLPYRVKCKRAEKLMFLLCRTCAENKNQSKCNHTPYERALIGIWTMDEVNKAIEKGYIIDKVYEVWHFEECTGKMFCEYIKTFVLFLIDGSILFVNKQ